MSVVLVDDDAVDAPSPLLAVPSFDVPLVDVPELVDDDPFVPLGVVAGLPPQAKNRTTIAGAKRRRVRCMRT